MATLLDQCRSQLILRYLGNVYLHSTNVPEADFSNLILGLQRLFIEAKAADVIMSKNETLEDVSTSSLLFVLLPFAIGDVMYHHTPFDRGTRLDHLERVDVIWREFIGLCDQLLGNSEAQVVGDARAAKVATLKRQNLLRPCVQHVWSSVASETQINSDDIRDSVVHCIEYFRIQCTNDLRFVQDEASILKMSDEDRELGVKDDPKPNTKPWTLKVDQTQLRSLVASQVFRPDVSMPTVSLQEFANAEMERMRIASKTRDNDEIIISGDVDDYYRNQLRNEHDKLLKDRSWDDWKDDNPRGTGNKMTNLG